MNIVFELATKDQAKARIALDGPSGSGKTWTALTLATTLGERVAVIDTEHGSASKYASLFRFSRLNLNKYDPAILVEALAVAGSAGFDVVVVDSLSHFWSGSDGMLEQVDRAGKRGGHGMSGWTEMRPTERKMVDAMLAYPGHMIATMRVKSHWVEEIGRNGKRQMVKVGTKAEQREGLEYEFDVVGSMSLDNELTIHKSRCPEVSGQVIQKPGRDLGETILRWLEDGEPVPTVGELRDQAIDQRATREQLLEVYGTAERLGLLAAPVVDDAGSPTILGELIVARGREVRAAAAAQQVAA